MKINTTQLRADDLVLLIYSTIPSSENEKVDEATSNKIADIFCNIIIEELEELPLEENLKAKIHYWKKIKEAIYFKTYMK